MANPIETPNDTTEMTGSIIASELNSRTALLEAQLLESKAKIDELSAAQQLSAASAKMVGESSALIEATLEAVKQQLFQYNTAFGMVASGLTLAAEPDQAPAPTSANRNGFLSSTQASSDESPSVTPNL